MKKFLVEGDKCVVRSLTWNAGIPGIVTSLGKSWFEVEFGGRKAKFLRHDRSDRKTHTMVVEGLPSDLVDA